MIRTSLSGSLFLTLQTRGALLAEARERLSKSGSASPRLDAEILLSFTLGVSRSFLLAHLDESSDDACARAFFSYIERREAGQSCAVITGVKEFRRLTLRVTRGTLIPRPETETLVEAALDTVGNFAEPAALLDLCTGSGAVGLALKDEAPFLDVTLADISGAALEVARRNALRLNLDVKVILSDLFQNIRGVFDIITANAPYVPRLDLETLPPEVKAEPRIALDGGADGLSVITRIIEDAGAFLKAGGVLLLEADPRQMGAIKALLGKNGFTDIKTERDLSGAERVVCGRLR